MPFCARWSKSKNRREVKNPDAFARVDVIYGERCLIEITTVPASESDGEDGGGSLRLHAKCQPAVFGSLSW